jgi:hypothetical protein
METLRFKQLPLVLKIAMRVIFYSACLREFAAREMSNALVAKTFRV